MRCRIAAVTFEPRTNDGPLDCTCGWVGQASGYAVHTGRVPLDTCAQGHNDWGITAKGSRRCQTCKAEQQKAYCERRKAYRKARREARKELVTA